MDYSSTNLSFFRNVLESVLEDLETGRISPSQLSSLERFWSAYSSQEDDGLSGEDRDCIKYLVTGWYVHSLLEDTKLD